MELLRYLSVLRSRWLFILLTTLVAAGAGYTLGSSEPAYTARATLYVGQQSVNFEPGQGNELTQDRLRTLDLYSYTFSKMVDSEVVAQRALAETPLDLTPSDVVDATVATPEVGTQLLYIDVTEDDPATSQTLANALADSFVESIQQFEPADEEGAVPRLPAYIFERAKLPTDPNPTNLIRTTLLATLFGLVVAVGVSLLLDYLDLTVRTPDDVERKLDLPVLGVIPSLGATLPTDPLYASSQRTTPAPLEPSERADA